MEITTKERYFYLSTMPLIVLGLLFLLIRYAPWANPNKICKTTEILSTEMNSDLPDHIFKIGEPIRLLAKGEDKVDSYNWFFGSFDKYEHINGSKAFPGNIIQYNDVGLVTVEVTLNGVCDISKKLEITKNCDDGIKNGEETGVDCGGACPDCEVVKEERKRNPIKKKDRYDIRVSDSNLECERGYTFTCVNISKENRVENDIIWIFDMIDTPIRGNPNQMKFTNKQKYVDHSIAAFKNGRVLATKKITVRCDDI